MRPGDVFKKDSGAGGGGVGDEGTLSWGKEDEEIENERQKGKTDLDIIRDLKAELKYVVVSASSCSAVYSFGLDYV